MSADIKPTSAAAAITELKKRGYDTSAIYRYACAARSWCERGSKEREIWQEVEKAMLAPEGAG